VNIQTEECTQNNQCGTNGICDIDFKCRSAGTIPIGEGVDLIEPPLTPEELREQERLACEAKAASNPFAGYTFVTRTMEPSFGSKAVTFITFGAIGDFSPTVETSCEARFAPYYIYGAILGVLVIGGFFAFRTLKNGSRRRR